MYILFTLRLLLHTSAVLYLSPKCNTKVIKQAIPINMTKHSLYIVLTSALICKQIFAEVLIFEYIWRGYFLFAWRTFFRGSSIKSVDSVARVKVMIAQRMSTNGSFFDHPMMFDLLVRKVSTGT